MATPAQRQALSKMVPGTLGGRARSATPVARRRPQQPKRRRPRMYLAAGVTFSASDGSGVAYSFDANTWFVAPTGHADYFEEMFTAIFLDSGRAIVAGAVSTGGLFRAGRYSDDDGTTWTYFDQPDNSLAVFALAADGDHVVLVGSSFPDWMAESHDGGTTWTAPATNLDSLIFFASALVKIPGGWAAGGYGFLGPGDQFSVWTADDADLTTWTPHHTTFDPSFGAVYGLFCDLDTGTLWAVGNDGASSSVIQRAALSDLDSWSNGGIVPTDDLEDTGMVKIGGRLVVTRYNGGISVDLTRYSDDDGATWIESDEVHEGADSPNFQQNIATDGRIVLAASDASLSINAAVFVSTDRGKSWSPRTVGDLNDDGFCVAARSG